MTYMVLVPIKPTKSMLHAAAKALSPGRRPTKEWVSVDEKHRIRYEAMIRAYVEDFPDRFVAVKDNKMRDWMPIETAPRDGTVVLTDEGTCRFNSQAYHQKWYLSDLDGYSPRCYEFGVEVSEREPRVWMPLPPPPNNAKVAEGESE